MGCPRRPTTITHVLERRRSSYAKTTRDSIVNAYAKDGAITTPTERTRTQFATLGLNAPVVAFAKNSGRILPSSNPPKHIYVSSSSSSTSLDCHNSHLGSSVLTPYFSDLSFGYKVVLVVPMLICFYIKQLVK